MNKNLLLLTSILIFAPISAMTRNTGNCDHARAEQIAQSLADGQPISASRTAIAARLAAEAKLAAEEPSTPVTAAMPAVKMPGAPELESKATAATFFERLPEDTLMQVKQLFLTEKFIRHAATFDIDIPTHAQVHTVYTDGHSIVAPLSFYPQGPDKLCTWNLATGRMLEDSPIEYAHQLRTIALTERYQVISFYKNTNYLEIKNRRTNEIVTLPIPGDTFLGSIQEIRISDDELSLAGIDNNKYIHIWRRREKDIAWELVYEGKIKGTSPIPDLTFSHNNQLLAIYSRQTVQIIDAKSGKELLLFTNHETVSEHNSICSINFTPDDTCIIVGSYAGFTTVHDATTGKLIRTLSTEDKYGNEVYMVKTNATGEHIITGHRNGMQRIWDFATGQLLLTLHRDKRIVHYANTKHTCPFTISRDNAKFAGPIKIHMAPEVFLALSLDQLELIRDLIQTRDKQTKKDQSKELILVGDKLELFKTLPPFVKTALSKNLQVNADLRDAVTIVNKINSENSDRTAAGIQRIIYEYAT